MRYAKHYSWEDYVALNTQVCEILQAKEEQAVLHRIEALTLG